MTPNSDHIAGRNLFSSYCSRQFADEAMESFGMVRGLLEVSLPINIRKSQASRLRRKHFPKRFRVAGRQLRERLEDYAMFRVSPAMFTQFPDGVCVGASRASAERAQNSPLNRF